jgi:hypothetical protein
LASKEPWHNLNEEETLFEAISGSLEGEFYGGEYPKGLCKARHLAI